MNRFIYNFDYFLKTIINLIILRTIIKTVSIRKLTVELLRARLLAVMIDYAYFFTFALCYRP